jgi:hypothetical protein
MPQVVIYDEIQQGLTAQSIENIQFFDATTDVPLTDVVASDLTVKWQQSGGLTGGAGGITRSGSTATFDCQGIPHGLTTGDTVMIDRADQSEYNKTTTVTVVSSTVFSYTVTGTPATPATIGGFTSTGIEYTGGSRLITTSDLANYWSTWVAGGLAKNPADTEFYRFCYPNELLAGPATLGYLRFKGSRFKPFSVKVTLPVFDPSAAGPTVTAQADALLDRLDGIETGLTPRQALRLKAAEAAGDVAISGNTVTIKNAIAKNKTRITATCDASGNRTVTATDLT